MKNPKTSIAGIVSIIIGTVVALLAGIVFPEKAIDITALGDQLETVILGIYAFAMGVIALVSGRDEISTENV